MILDKDQLFSMNRPFLEEMFEKFLKNPDMDPDWQEFFKDFIDPRVIEKIIQSQGGKIQSSENSSSHHYDFLKKVWHMIFSFHKYGYRADNINPLNTQKSKLFVIDDFGFTKEEQKIEIDLKGYLNLNTTNILNIFHKLQETFCNGKLHFELNHLQDPEVIDWCNDKLQYQQYNYSAEEKQTFWTHLAEAEIFEQFIHKKYIGAKRFSIEGGESTIVALEHLINKASLAKVKELAIGMSHRGRLSILTKVIGKPYDSLFNEFNGNSFCPDEFDIDSDVKYHHGFSADRIQNDHTIHLSLMPNPSHLESVNNVLLGSVYSKQQNNAHEVIPVLLHGDAAFTGQGSVGEMLAIKDIEGYNCHGTIHIIINNQIGFTADVQEVRNDPLFPTNMMRCSETPIMHINGEEPEAVAKAIEIAFEFRQKFKKSVILNIICYRRYGHNEGDEPRFTQPQMYALIDKMPTIMQKYREHLVFNENHQSEFFTNFQENFNKKLQEKFEKAKKDYQYQDCLFQGHWSVFRQNEFSWNSKTGVKKKLLQELADKIFDFTNYDFNEKLKKILEQRHTNIKNDQALDWGAAENLAIASLVHEKIPVRISGQDVGRGTFAHRHGKITDKNTGAKHTIFHQINPEICHIYNSPLSEFGVLGFEYGFSTAHPQQLVIWEAQFGDFANGAQVIIDQFIASGEHKWLRISNLVVSLPHGYEGQGSEHSSGRMERFLQLCANDNMQIVNCSTPGNHFHALRRQVHATYRKPLIAFTPKSILRHKMAVSYLKDLEGKFEPILEDKITKPKKIILCSGKVYYDLKQEMQARSIEDYYIIRIEQLFPFPQEQISKILKKIDPKHQIPIIWLQEEPKNMGAWSFVQEIFLEYFADKQITYIGRQKSAVPAVGTVKQHKAQYNKFMELLFS